MEATLKPHIKKVTPTTWQCQDPYLRRCGTSWRQAYDRWLTASIKDAMAARQPEEGHAPDRQQRPAAATPGPALRQAGSAMPKKAGQPITVKKARDVPRAAPIEQLTYPESMVQKILQPIDRPEYSPSVVMRDNLARAEAAQPALMTIFPTRGGEV